MKLHIILPAPERFVLKKAKAQSLFIGPRGGRWANPQHTIPWRPMSQRERPAQLTKVPKKRKWVEKRPGMPEETTDLYRNKDKSYKKERLPVHAKIINQFL